MGVKNNLRLKRIVKIVLVILSVLLFWLSCYSYIVEDNINGLSLNNPILILIVCLALIFLDHNVANKLNR